MSRLAFFLLVTIIMFSSQWVHAVPVETFTFQGLLRDSSGNLITGQKDITFRLYTIPTGGSASSTPGLSCPKSTAPFCVWQENQTNIGVTNGIFTIFAGNQTSLNRVDFTKALYLEVIIRSGTIGNYGADQVLSPRINLTASPFALSTERGNFGYFNGTQFLINQTSTSSAKTVFNVTNMGIGTLVNLKSGATFNNILNITAGSLTTGSAINITSKSASPAYRNLVVINNNNTAADAAIGLFINQAGDAPAIAIKARGGGISNTGVLNITATSLTSGSAVIVKSESADATVRNLVNLTSTKGTATTVLRLNQGSSGNILNVVNASGAETLKVSGAGVVTTTQLKVNTTGTTLFGIYKGSRAAANIGEGINQITVTNAGSGDVASCSFEGANSAANVGARFFLTIGNVTNNAVFVNVTRFTAAHAFSGINCVVFDITE